MKAHHYKTDGTINEITPADGKRFTLKEMQGYVGGWVERAPQTGTHEIWVNEEDRLKGAPPNTNASLLGNQNLVGDAVVCMDSCWEDIEDDAA